MTAEHDAMLAGLIAQARDEGVDLVTLRALVEEASELGATRALTRIGLSDAGAGRDIGELRALLKAWRETKASVRMTLVAWTVKWVLAMVVLGLGLKLGLGGMAR
jgi:hypothetical protein